MLEPGYLRVASSPFMGSAVAYWAREWVNSAQNAPSGGVFDARPPPHFQRRQTMHTRTGRAGFGILFGCLLVAACGNQHPTGMLVDAEQNYSVEVLPDGEEYGGGEATTQSDTTTQRGIGGFGSGN